MNESIFHNGTIITIDPERPRAEAVLVRDNRIAAVGTAAEIKRAASRAASWTDLQGRTLVPGFIDAHIHLANLGMRELQVDLKRLTKAEIIERLRDASTGMKDGEPLLAFGWDYDACPDPHKTDLDEVFRDRPVVLFQFSGHAAWVNSSALAYLKIGPSTRDWQMGGPDRDESGELTGILREPGHSPQFRRFWFARMKDRRAIRTGLATAMQRMSEHGITSVHDNTWFPQTVSELARLHRRDEQTCRVSCWSLGRSRRLDTLFSLTRFDDEWYARGPRKHFWDGAFSSHTALLCEPYVDRPDTRGHGTDADEIEPILRRAVRRGRQVAAHSIGDAATKAYCDALERLPDRPGVRELRFRVEHGQLIRDEDVERIKDLGMIVSAQPHAAADPAKDERLLGRERAEHAYPFRTLIDAGVPLAFGSDYPGEGTYDPLFGIFLAVNRQGSEAISAEEALACYTAGGAYAEWQEDRKGRIREGFLADFALLSHDPTTLPPEQIKDIVVDATVVDGRVVYERAGHEPPRQNMV